MVRVNAKAAGLLGRTVEQLVGRHVWTELPETMGSAFADAYAQVMTTRTDLRIEHYFAPWGRWFENRIFPTEEGLLILFSETTAAHHERAIADRDAERLRALLSATAATAWWTDPTGAVVEPIPSWQAYTGQTEDEARGSGWLEAIHPDDRAYVSAAWQEAVATRTPYVVEHRLRRHDGEWRYAQAHGVPVLDADGAVREWVGTQVDVTDERAAAQALVASEARHRSLSASSPVGIFESDNAGHVTYANDRAAQIWEMPIAESLGMGWTAHVHPEDLPSLHETWMAALDTGQEYAREYRLLLGDGRIRWVHGRSAPLRDAAGVPIGTVGTIEDVTGRRELEARLRQAQKMEAVGQLAGGIAHDFNNLLTVILGNLELAASDLTPEHPVHADLAEVMTAAARAAALVRQLLVFSRQQVLTRHAVDLNDAVRAAQRLLPRVIGEEITLDVSVADAPLMVVADPGQLEQVLLNLAINARDAMLVDGAETHRVGGTLRIATSAHELAPGESAQWSGMPPGPCVRLTLRDSGHGMDALTASRAFEPFFTTKPVGAGTGLGLATVYGIVQQSGGAIRVESAPGAGTVIDILLPRADDAAAARTRPLTGESDAVDPDMHRAPRDGVVLLAEDEAAVRAAVRRLLEQRGYAVVEAAHGVEALAQWRARRAEICAVVTDLRMPQMGGPAFVRQVRLEAPTLPIVYMSGYAERGEIATLGAHETFVEKPLTGDRLWRALAEVLASTR